MVRSYVEERWLVRGRTIYLSPSIPEDERVLQTALVQQLAPNEWSAPRLDAALFERCRLAGPNRSRFLGRQAKLERQNTGWLPGRMISTQSDR
jgi:hypothetical protein